MEPQAWGVEGLVVRAGRTVLVRDVDLDTRPGLICAVVGADGAGKTTVLRALAGAIAPSEGQIRRPPKARIGYVSAGPGLYHDLTVLENLQFVGQAYGVRDDSFRKRSATLMARTGLEAARDRLAGRLSGGMRQKLALAMALLHDPELLVLDEPTTGLDPVSRAELWGLIGGAAVRGAAVVLSTTYLDEAERATMVLVLSEGRPLLNGPPSALIAATPGLVFEIAERPADLRTWRHGMRWRGWLPDGPLPVGGSAVPIGLEDAAIVAALAWSLSADRATPTGCGFGVEGGMREGRG